MMLSSPPRLRMFAGPNGSGKSTLKSVIRPDLLGIYINPDELEAGIRRDDFLDFNPFNIRTSHNEVLDFFLGSTLLSKADLLDAAAALSFDDNRLIFSAVKINSYFASVAADFIRQKLISAGKSFSFETVMSSPDKVQLLAKSRQVGYRNYLYFVATDDPNINISRVEHRVQKGGHDVPNEKIVARYQRSLDLLWDAIQLTDRAYIFDNSGDKLLWLAEITAARHVEIKSDFDLFWFQKYIVDKSSSA